MVPQIRAKYRKKFGIKFTVEQFIGRQYRCLHCNETFLSENELLRHLQRKQTNNLENKNIKPPKLGDSVKATLLYTEDIRDEFRQKLIKSKYKE
jgi:hypothetical protein